MAILKIKTEAKTPGEAQNFLRGIISMMNNGVKDGKGWVFGEGEIEKPEIRAKLLHPILQELTFKLMERVAYHTAEDSKDILPQDYDLLCHLLTALRELGYGEDVSEGSDEGHDSAPAHVEGGDAPKVGGEENVAPSASQGLTQEEAEARGRQFPWDKDK